MIVGDAFVELLRNYSIYYNEIFPSEGERKEKTVL